MKINKIISIGLCSLLFSSVAFAGKGDKSKKSFETVDADKDGKISLAEFSAGAKDEAKAKTRFKKKDKDDNGFLNKKEFSKEKGPKKAPKKKGPKKPKKDNA